MPYIITTSEPFNAAVHVHRPAFTRTAVATLEEARTVVREALAQHPMGADTHEQADDVFAHNGTGQGTIGPLPDGTVIEVERVDRQTLVDALDGDYAANTHLDDAALLAAFNA